MRWVGVAEGIVLIGGMFVVERSGMVDFNALPIHPLMIVVALLAVQYGALGGLATALAAICLSVIGGALPARIVGEGYFDYLAAVWSTPLLWVAIALLLGIVSDNNRRALSRAEGHAETLRQERDLIASQYEILSARARRLERVAVGLEPRSREKS